MLCFAIWPFLSAIKTFTAIFGFHVSIFTESFPLCEDGLLACCHLSEFMRLFLHQQAIYFHIDNIHLFTLQMPFPHLPITALRRLDYTSGSQRWKKSSSFLVSKWPHEWGLSESTLFYHIWNHFHRVNHVLLPKTLKNALFGV